MDKLSVTQQCALVERRLNSTLDCIGMSIANRGRLVIQPLYSTLVRSVWSTVSSSGLPSRHTGVWDLLVHGDIKIQIELGKVLSNLL